jgi:predicted HTH domain antitoxin
LLRTDSFALLLLNYRNTERAAATERQRRTCAAKRHFNTCQLGISHYPKLMLLTLEMPDSAFSSLRRAPDDFASELKLAACVKWYELGRLSQAKAAEIAGLSRAEFIDALRDYRVPAIQTEPGSLAKELLQ